MPPSMCDFAATLRYDDLPDALLVTLRRSLLDSLGVAAIGSTTALASIARKTARALFGPGEAGAARILFDGGAVSPAGAAMAGAFTIDSIDAHDGSSPNKGHAGSAVFPALLAIADAQMQRGETVTGRDLAVWLAMAYEIAYRAGRTQHATCADYHTSGAWTAVGVAVAGARMLGCGAEQIRHAAGIAEYHGPRSQMMRCIDHPTMLRDGVGWGAPSGVTAAYLAREGFTGAPAVTCEGDEAAPFWSDIGSAWRSVEDTHYKPFPCCRWAHPAMDGALALMAEHALTPAQVAGVRIRTFHNATRLAGHEPRTLDELTYAIAFPVAAVIARGGFGSAELAPETLSDPEILRLSRATQLIDDPHLTEISVGKRWAQVTIVTRDGRELEDAPRTPRGDPDNPLSDTELDAKFHGFADPVLGAKRAKRIAGLARRFDGLDGPGIEALLGLTTDDRDTGKAAREKV